MLIPEELQSGDVLLYRPSSLIGLLICIKSWTMLSHSEIYYGQGKVIAARQSGVDIYDERIDKHLRFVRRPVLSPGKQFDVAGAYKAVQPMLGKAYEIRALFDFYLPWKRHYHANRICSSVVTVALRGGGVEPFNPKVDADDIAPAQLWQTPELTTVWESSKVCQV